MSKRIVFCADGTWNSPHGVATSDPDTNVRKIYGAIQDSPDQLKYYDSGVGTDGTPIDHLIGGTMGEGLFQKVQDGYEFLSYVYDPGDQIYLFGFSRGAYTARSLAGMLAAFGVPMKNLDNMTVRSVFSAYRERDAGKKAQLKAGLKSMYEMVDVTVRMLGVWDTVGALGVPGLIFSVFDQQRYGFLDTKLHPCVESACHAVSIDERRASFIPTLWVDDEGKARSNDANVEQVWFTGVHSDVGGGYDDCQLSDIALSWMMGKAAQRGIVFTPDILKQRTSIDVSYATAPKHDEWNLVPWGFPRHRDIPVNAVLSNSVGLRYAKDATYRPENLHLANAPDPSPFKDARVIPYVLASSTAAKL